MNTVITWTIITLLIAILAGLIIQKCDLCCKDKPVQTTASQDLELDSISITDKMIEEGTSVYCQEKSSNSNRRCHFRNLCYNSHHDAFLFLHSAESERHGLPENRFQPALLDLSSVRDHNRKYFNYVDVPSSIIKDLTPRIITKPSFIFSRFLPENIMHVFHDDLLPMYYTLRNYHFQLIRNIRTDYQLVLMDDFTLGDYSDLYSIFTTNQILIKNTLKPQNQTVCFTEAWVGISKHTTWYQYGFQRPQGPLLDTKLTSDTLDKFTSFIQYQVGVSFLASSDYLVLISRKTNRLIINEMELIMAITQEIGFKVKIVSLETHSLSEIVDILSSAKGAIGMHGSLLILAMFLPKGAFLLEMFPYAIDAQHYLPYKTMIGIQKYKSYDSWQNKDVQTTVTHPEYTKELGGLAHLTTEQQEAILKSDRVRPHLCCNDPEWLFRIYQDTIVNVPAVIDKIKNLVFKSQMDGQTDEKGKSSYCMYPAEVRNLTYKVTTADYRVYWERPWNIEFIAYRHLEYEVWLQYENRDDYTAYVTKLPEITFTKHLIEIGKSVNIWVMCQLDNRDGPQILLQI